MSAMVAAEQLVDEGAVHLMTEERGIVVPTLLLGEVDDDGCAEARCRFRCLRNVTSQRN